MRKGTLGTVSIVLPEWDFGDEAQPYSRQYKPITPASRVISGDNDSVAPETDIATWSIQDWSGGEGDIRWKDRGRYNVSDGCGPVSDGSGVTIGAKWEYVAATHTTTMVRCGGQLVSGGYGNGSLYNWSGTNHFWYSNAAIGDSNTADILGIGAVDDDIWFVIENVNDFRKVESSGNSLYFATSYAEEMVAYNGVLYYIGGTDLYWLNRTTAGATKVWDGSGTAVYDIERIHRMSKSDKGPIWYTPFNDGTTPLYEYNAADDASYVIGELPKDVYANDVAFHNGTYYIAYRDAAKEGQPGDAYLWYKTGRNGASGVIGPFRSVSSSLSSSSHIAIAGVIGDRIMVVYQERLWAYDLSDGAISLVADFSSSLFSDVRSAVTYGSDVLAGSDFGYVWLDTRKFQLNQAQTLTTGSYDYGYIGLPKLIHTVSISLESEKYASGTMEVGHAVDGGAVTWLPDEFSSTAFHQWTVSSPSSSVIGTDIEWSIRLTTIVDTECPKVVALTSDVSGAKSRIEWLIAVDVGESSVTDGGDVIAALNALKTSHAVVEWSDPFQVSEYEAADTFDVRVMEISTPKLSDDGYQFATVRFQTIGLVG